MLEGSLMCRAPKQSPFAQTIEVEMDGVERGGMPEAGQKDRTEVDVKIVGTTKSMRRRTKELEDSRQWLSTTSTLPNIARSTSLTDPDNHNLRRSDPKSKRSTLSVNVSRPPERSWSFTKTTWSPSIQNDLSSILEVINRSKETQQDLMEALKLSPQKVIISESEECKSGNFKAETRQQLAKDGVRNQKKQQVQGFKVKPTTRTTVPASAPPDTCWILLSNLDRVVNPTFSSVIHYYENAINDQRSFLDLTRSLKNSLANTLVDFYPFAGRLQLREDGTVDLRCNNDGAVWIEAVVDANLKDVGGARPNHLLSGLQTARLGLGPIYVPDQLRDMPVLIIQVTQFKCGSVAIGTSWHHTVADGFSGLHFMRSWSEVALGKPISTKPIHEREILKPRDPLNPTLVTGYSTENIDEERSNGMAVNVSEETKLQAFHLDATAIADLKRQANLEAPPFTPRQYTSAEAISGHLWRQMTKARAAANSYNSSLAKDQTTKFFMFVDGRKRLRLPSGYFGNVVCSACAVAKEADILNNPLTYAASMIRSATRNITEEYFRSLIDWVEVQGASDSKSEHVNSLGHDVAATFWTFFPMYDIEFGWGKPVYAARNSPPRPLIDGIAMMPNNDGKGMTALLNLHSDRMSKLEKQISFTTVFHD